MKKLLTVLVSIVLFSLGSAAQKAKPKPNAPVLRLIASTPLPGVEGDCDHFAFDVKGNRLFLAAEDHKSVEVFNLRTAEHLRSIPGFGTPHSILPLPESNKIFVVDGGAGEVKVLDAHTYAVKDSIKLLIDADSMVYDAKNKKLYVVNGGKDAKPKTDYSLISIIDTDSLKHVGDMKVDNDHVEAMAIEESGPRLFVNITGKNQIGVFDREKKELLTTWNVPDAEQNVPMAFDEADHRLFIATRKPPKMIVFDTESGHAVASLPASGRADDMRYDAAHKRIFVAAGEGFVNVYLQKDPDHYEVIGKVPTGPVGKIATYVPELNRLYVSVSAKGKAPARVMVFQARP
jgi:DNA-binding beta-propeller fold protein YncE